MAKQRKVGRPEKYDTIDLSQVEKLAGYGLIEDEIADVLGIAKSSLSLYKSKYPEFSEVLKRGKVRADSKVIESLYKRATGYLEDDTYFSSYQGVVTQTPYKKVILPDVVAEIFWLKNRRRQDWRDREFELSGATKDELTKVMAAYAQAFMAHPGQGVESSRNSEVPGE